MKSIIRILALAFIATALFPVTASATPPAAVQKQPGLLYDSALRIYLPQDANSAKSMGFTQTYGRNGFMILNDALRFIDALNSSAHLGIRNWRLPTIAELQHLATTDGIRTATPAPLIKLGSYYWADGQRSFGFILGAEVSFAAYRFVLPVATPTYSWSGWRPPSIGRIPRYPFQRPVPFPFPRP